MVLGFVEPCDCTQVRACCLEFCKGFLPSLRDLAKEGEVSALSSLAHFHILGILGVEASRPIAIELLEKAAARGCGRCAYKAAMLLEEDRTDVARMRRVFQVGAFLGHHGCIHKLAVCLETGVGGSIDLAGAFHWDIIGAEKASPQSAFRCGCFLWDGSADAVPRDRSQAVRYWELAAENDHSEAMYCMALVQDISFSNTADPHRRQILLDSCCEWLARARRAGCLHPRAHGRSQVLGVAWATDELRPALYEL